MSKAQVVWPVVTLVLATLTLYIRLLGAKKRAAKDGNVDTVGAALNQNLWPEAVQKINNNITNQFASPTLFYVCIGMLWALDAVDVVVVVMAWVFVAARLGHMAIHTTSNVVKWRVKFFTLSIVTILGLLVMVVLAAAKA